MPKYTPHANIYEPQKELNKEKWWNRLIIDDRFYTPNANIIDWFMDEYRWLSNYHAQPIIYNGLLYQTTEAAYQATKTNLKEAQEDIRLAKSPAKAKKLGQAVPMRPDWEDIKEQVMREVVWLKFNADPILQQKLIDTGDAYLVEGTVWHDNIWGICVKKDCEKCQHLKGKNLLGKILMETRLKFKN